MINLAFELLIIESRYATELKMEFENFLHSQWDEKRNEKGGKKHHRDTADIEKKTNQFSG